MPVVRVESLTWMVANVHLGNPPLSQCPTNGGQRIYPDMNNPEDEHVGAKGEVRLRAQVEPPVRNLTVYFRVFDVDDPFDQVHGPEGRNDVQYATEVDNDRVGNDNRPDSLGVGNYTAITNEFGFASITVPVSKQPGNNYRAAASLIIGNGLTQVTQQQADDLSAATDTNGKFAVNGDFTGYQCPVVWSPMLTVWRRLHVEFDSMEAESVEPADRSPDWKAVTVTSVTNNLATATLFLAETLQDHQYEGGRIEFQNGTFVLPVRDNSTGSVEVGRILTPAEIAAIDNHLGRLKDDDPDSGVLPLFYTVDSYIQNAYNDAYVRLLALPTAYNFSRTFPFKVYLESGDLGSGDPWATGNDIQPIPSFWATRVVTGYQYGSLLLTKDNDPDPLQDNSTYPSGPFWAPISEYSELIQHGYTLTDGDWDSVVFRAAIRDMSQGGYSGQDEGESQTVAHEIGHSAGNSGSESSHHAEGGLMKAEPTESDTRFTGRSLKRFRGVDTW